jgi:hypothetical protein
MTPTSGTCQKLGPSLLLTRQPFHSEAMVGGAVHIQTPRPHLYLAGLPVHSHAQVLGVQKDGGVCEWGRSSGLEEAESGQGRAHLSSGTSYSLQSLEERQGAGEGPGVPISGLPRTPALPLLGP